MNKQPLRGNPLDTLDVGQEYRIWNGKTFCIVEYNNKKHRAVGRYKDFISMTKTEQKAHILENFDSSIEFSIPHVLIEGED